MRETFYIKNLLIAVFLILLSPGSASALLTVDMEDHGRILRIVGKDSGDRTGIHVELVDLVGDPTPDVLVSSDFAEDYEEDRTVGRVDVFDGATLPRLGYIDLENPIPRPALTLFGEDDDGAFGRRVTVGDYDGDNVPDLAVSAPTYDANDEGQSGRIYLFFGGVVIPSEGRTLFNLNSDHLNASEAHVMIDGAFRRDQVGTEMIAQDFDNDGRDDLVLAAPNTQEDLPDESGRVFVVHARSDWLATPKISLQEALDPVTFPEYQEFDKQIRVIDGPLKFARIGESLAAADLDNNGFHELLLGAPNESISIQAGGNTATLLRPGRIHLFESQTLFPNPPAIEPIQLANTRADFTFTGQTQFDLLGKGIFVTDWNGDGVDDFWVGVPFWELLPADPEDFDEDDEGLATLFRGSGLVDLPGRFLSDEVVYPTGFITSIGGPDDDGPNEALFGATMNEGDVLGNDGTTELIIGASRYDAPGDDNDSGALSIVTRSQMANHPPNLPLQLEFEAEAMRIYGEESFDRFGFQIDSADLFPTAGDEVAVGAPQADGITNISGVVYIFNPNLLAFELDATMTPTHVETATPIPTFTFTPTNTFTPSNTPTITPTPTGSPTGASKFDLDKTGVVDYRDLWMFSTHWMGEPSTQPVFQSQDLVDFLSEVE